MFLGHLKNCKNLNIPFSDTDLIGSNNVLWRSNCMYVCVLSETKIDTRWIKKSEKETDRMKLISSSQNKNGHVRKTTDWSQKSTFYYNSTRLVHKYVYVTWYHYLTKYFAFQIKMATQSFLESYYSFLSKSIMPMSHKEACWL